MISQDHSYHNVNFEPVFFSIIFDIFWKRGFSLLMLGLDTFLDHLPLLAYVKYVFIFTFFIAMWFYYEIIV